MGKVLKAVRIVNKKLCVRGVGTARWSRRWLHGEGVEGARQVDVDDRRNFILCESSLRHGVELAAYERTEESVGDCELIGCDEEPTGIRSNHRKVAEARATAMARGAIGPVISRVNAEQIPSTSRIVFETDREFEMALRSETEHVRIKAILGDYEKLGTSGRVMVASGVRNDVAIDGRIASSNLRVQLEELVGGGRALQKCACRTVYRDGCVNRFHHKISADTEPCVGRLFVELGVAVNPIPRESLIEVGQPVEAEEARVAIRETTAHWSWHVAAGGVGRNEVVVRCRGSQITRVRPCPKSRALTGRCRAC